MDVNALKHQNVVLLESLKRLAQENPMFCYELVTKWVKETEHLVVEETTFQNISLPEGFHMAGVDRLRFLSRQTGRDYRRSHSRTSYKTNEPAFEGDSI